MALVIRSGKVATDEAPRLWRGGAPLAWLALAVLLVATSAVPLVRPVDNDFWWHARTGAYVLQHGIPRHDPFSWTRGGDAWVAHEWLSEVVIALLVPSVGYGAALAVFVAAGLASLAVAAALARSLGARPSVVALLSVVACGVVAPFLTVRPQLLSWPLFALTFASLTADQERPRRGTWLLPPMFALWANLHLGFLFGLLLVGLWWVAAVWERARGYPGRQIGRASAIAILCVVAASANPSGPALLWYPLRYISDGQVAAARVAEWQRPDITFPLHGPIFVTVVALVLSALVRPRPRAFHVLVALTFAGLSLDAVRHAPFAAIALLPIAGPAIARRTPQPASPTPEPRVPLFAAVLALALVVALGAAAAASSGAAVSPGRPDERGYPAAAAEYIRAHHTSESRLWNDYNSGGFLIDQLYPEVRVFVDGRTDFYGDALLQDYITMQDAKDGWRELFDQYEINLALVPDQVALATALESEPGWARVYEEGGFAVYERR
jgi:hypothetical protein